MAKRATRATKRAKRVNGRVNTFKANGGLAESREVAPPRRGRPRQADLPGTEDRLLQPLEDIAAAYADVRDRRIDLNREEADLKASALELMHRFQKTIYKRDGIEIRLVAGEEDVKVKVRKATDDGADGDDEDDGTVAIAEAQP
jgi:hypothetical protein